MAKFCEICGDKMSIRNSFVYKGQNLCGGCLDDIEDKEAEERSKAARGEIANNTRTSLKYFFHNENEKLMAVLGQGYITSIIQGVFKKGILFVTDKRLYQEGTIFYRTSSGLSSKKGSSVVHIRDITGIEFQEVNITAVIVFAFISFLIGLIPFIMDKDLWPILIFGWTVSIVSVIVYLSKRYRIFVVKFAGGEIAVDCRWYSEQELRNFQRAISKIKDSLDSG